MNKKLTKWIVLALIMVVTLVTLAGCGKTAEDKKTDALEGLAVYTQDEDMTDYTKCTEMEGVEFYVYGSRNIRSKCKLSIIRIFKCIYI